MPFHSRPDYNPLRTRDEKKVEEDIMRKTVCLRLATLEELCAVYHDQFEETRR